MRFSKYIGVTVFVAFATAVAPGIARASSHREAPLIGEDPAADNCDLYAFVSPDDPNSVTIIATYIPLEEPGGGPNWQRFSDSVLYEINIDNNQDGAADLSYQFNFQTFYNPALANGAAGTFFYNVGHIDGVPTPRNFHNSLVAQTYTVTRVQGNNRTPVGYNIPVAPVHVGRFAYGSGGQPATSDAAYESIAYNAAPGGTIRTLMTGETVWAGQSDDPFFVDLGAVFDDATFRGAGSNPINLGDRGGGIDYVSGYNVHTIAIKIPINRLVVSGATPDPMDVRNVIGVYASASRQRVQVVRREPPQPPPRRRFPLNDMGMPDMTASVIATAEQEMHGQFVQVSRLGIPLVNEVLIPLAQKDRWNGLAPENDAANFGQYLLVPSLPTYAQVLYGATGVRAGLGYVAPTRSATNPMNDMLLLVTGRVGIAGVPTAGLTPSDVLRLNVRTPPSALPANVGRPNLPSGTSALGAAGNDTAGFPNGRRLFDDVVDIELRYVLNGLSNLNAIPFGDGVDGNDRVYRTTFPYVPTAFAGSEGGLAAGPHRTEPAR